MRELTVSEVDCISGGAIPVAVAIVVVRAAPMVARGIGTIGASFGAGFIGGFAQSYM